MALQRRIKLLNRLSAGPNCRSKEGSCWDRSGVQDRNVSPQNCDIAGARRNINLETQGKMIMKYERKTVTCRERIEAARCARNIGLHGDRLLNSAISLPPFFYSKRMVAPMALHRTEYLPPVTLGHIRGHGCRDLLVYCNPSGATTADHQCRSSAGRDGDPAARRSRMVCTRVRAGRRGRAAGLAPAHQQAAAGIRHDGERALVVVALRERRVDSRRDEVTNARGIR